MAASKTVLQLSPSHNSVVPRPGVVTLLGYRIQIRVDRGHLLLDDGMGADRRHFRLSRVGHGLRRLVVIGSDGFVSLAALRWLHALWGWTQRWDYFTLTNLIETA